MNATTATSSSNNQRLRVAVAGASGRMGRMLIEAIAQSDDLALAATMDHLAICAELGVKLVIGTTGFSDEEKARIAEYAQRTAVVLSPNMSVGVNVTFKLLEMAAKALSSGYDIEIVEAHHRHKVDAP